MTNPLSPLTRPTRSALSRSALLLGGATAAVAVGTAPSSAADPFSVIDNTIATVNDGVLYSPALAPTTTAVETAIITSPLGPAQDAVNARYARVKGLLAP